MGVNRLDESGVGGDHSELPRRHRAEARRAGAPRKRGTLPRRVRIGAGRHRPPRSLRPHRRHQSRDAGDVRVPARRAARPAAARLRASRGSGRPPRAISRISPKGRIDHCRAERRIIRKDNHPVWVNLTASLVRDANTRPRFCLAMLENITERKHAESALQDTNRRLADWVSELEQRKREISLLSEMGDMLRACRSPEEAYGVIEPMASQLFPLESGSVSVLTPGTALVETVAQWGDAAGAPAVFGGRLLGAAARAAAPGRAGTPGAGLQAPRRARRLRLHLRADDGAGRAARPAAHGDQREGPLARNTPAVRDDRGRAHRARAREPEAARDAAQPVDPRSAHRALQPALHGRIARARDAAREPRTASGRHHHARPRSLQEVQRLLRSRRRRRADAHRRQHPAAQHPRGRYRLPLRRRGVHADSSRGVARSTPRSAPSRSASRSATSTSSTAASSSAA